MKHHQLEPYQELIGTLQAVKTEEDRITVIISGAILRYPLQSPEGQFLKKSFRPERIGQKVGILDEGGSLRVRWPEDRDRKPSGFWRWFLKEFHEMEGVD